LLLLLKKNFFYYITGANLLTAGFRLIGVALGAAWAIISWLGGSGSAVALAALFAPYFLSVAYIKVNYQNLNL
jgi:hypothetical protein